MAGGYTLTLIRLTIWVATAFFVGMLFSPLVREMLARLGPGDPSGMP